MVAINERKDLIDALRAPNRTIAVYRDTDLSVTVMSLAADQRLKLTGIVGDGLAQIKEPTVGWVQSLYLKQISDGGMTKGKAYRLRNTSELSQGLAAYYEPGAKMNDGPGANSIVYLTNPEDSYVENGRKLIRVFFVGKFGSERAGYVSQGTVGSVLGETSSNFVAV
ncbi:MULTISPECIES: hypothetical protein [unclassified Leptolyngbya]|uniref:hypothetical protein n=1 Tax=unclassified Leptolyngbya TaxID=2650499 RepID=UPI0016839642|nr:MULTISPECIES: hypothetical protein [unclassified Leptolyngbya]MBD1911371.1 hypothetical protein [Leptolyngbya sp. FACHB-8]MBD2156611.1 hypothetical protein [Leptolyngbya sp. FACHB-16]